jgi:hypothetical protein
MVEQTDGQGQPSILKRRDLDPYFFYWSICTKPVKWAVMHLCLRGVDVASFYDVNIWPWHFGIFFIFILFTTSTKLGGELYTALYIVKGWLNNAIVIKDFIIFDIEISLFVKE